MLLLRRVSRVGQSTEAASSLGTRFASASHTTARTRLADDLTPRSYKGSRRRPKLLDVAPREPRAAFTREPLPHTEFKDRDRTRSGRPLDLKHRRDERKEPRAERRIWWKGNKDSSEEGRWRGPSPLAQKAATQIEEEFDFSTTSPPLKSLPAHFTSPPLVDGLLQSVHDVLGPEARPTPIQSLSLKHLFAAPTEEGTYRQFLLASETGSGKSLAYLLPMLQDIKQSELSRPLAPSKLASPRGLVLAPTHELSRQLASFAKALIHNIKLRVQSTSRANVASAAATGRVSASKMAGAFGARSGAGEFEVRQGGVGHAVDVLVGTPSKLLEMVRGNGWDHEARVAKEGGERERETPKRKWVVGRPEMGLENVEWVVVDEADILFDPDFIEQTRTLLADIALARGGSATETPFNLILTSATIPASLAAHLDAHHPHMTRLVSPHLHRLPSKLKLEFAAYASGNRHADVERRLRDVWAADALEGREPSKVVVFGNTRTGVEEFGRFLSGKGIENVAVTGAGGRAHGSNKHLEGFLKPLVPRAETQTDATEARTKVEGPRVLLSTSLLARGLDFDPSVSHVFVLDPPRNTADFLHRAGRTARAGGVGKVVVFEKAEGRGSERGKEMKRRIRALKARK